LAQAGISLNTPTYALVLDACPLLCFLAWNTLLLRLESIQLFQGHDEFRWNLQSNGKFSVSLLYNAIIQRELQVDKNKKI
jgi:hypothetical protein